MSPYSYFSLSSKRSEVICAQNDKKTRFLWLWCPEKCPEISNFFCRENKNFVCPGLHIPYNFWYRHPASIRPSALELLSETRFVFKHCQLAVLNYLCTACVHCKTCPWQYLSLLTFALSKPQIWRCNVTSVYLGSGYQVDTQLLLEIRLVLEIH